MDHWALGLLIERVAILGIQHWLNHEVFTLGWWYLLFLFIVPWMIWYRLVDTGRLPEIVLAGLLSIVITTFINELGSELNFWQYPIQFVPISLLGLPFDFSVIAVTYMLLYQYFGSWRSYALALFCMALVFAFIGEPFSAWMKVIYYVRWNYFCSFIYYLATGAVIRSLTRKIMQSEMKRW